MCTVLFYLSLSIHNLSIWSLDKSQYLWNRDIFAAIFKAKFYSCTWKISCVWIKVIFYSITWKLFISGITLDLAWWIVCIYRIRWFESRHCLYTGLFCFNISTCCFMYVSWTWSRQLFQFWELIFYALNGKFSFFLINQIQNTKPKRKTVNISNAYKIKEY